MKLQIALSAKIKWMKNSSNGKDKDASFLQEENQNVRGKLVHWLLFLGEKEKKRKDCRPKNPSLDY